jgi:hypothetical protein
VPDLPAQTPAHHPLLLLLLPLPATWRPCALPPPLGRLPPLLPQLLWAPLCGTPRPATCH